MEAEAKISDATVVCPGDVVLVDGRKFNLPVGKNFLTTVERIRHAIEVAQEKGGVRIHVNPDGIEKNKA